MNFYYFYRTLLGKLMTTLFSLLFYHPAFLIPEIALISPIIYTIFQGSNLLLVVLSFYFCCSSSLPTYIPSYAFYCCYSSSSLPLCSPLQYGDDLPIPFL